VARARTLMAELKQALQAVMKAGADATKERPNDAGASSSDAAPAENGPQSGADEFRRALEIFDSICDQIEANFMIMQDLHREQVIGDRFAPFNVSPNGQKPMPGEDSSQFDGAPNRPFLTYKEYEELAKTQKQFAASIRNSFLECSRLLE